ncbi:hypothetical protein LCGC14_2056070, partial [marine sediment metagenome]
MGHTAKRSKRKLTGKSGFQTGHTKIGGRQKGSKNKHPGLKDAWTTAKGSTPTM